MTCDTDRCFLPITQGMAQSRGQRALATTCDNFGARVATSYAAEVQRSLHSLAIIPSALWGIPFKILENRAAGGAVSRLRLTHAENEYD